ncbi:unnamed protein product [Echinostoma caproni]|uniref:Uncharacterized protein n=1 Tax=Echinostoma caproni TaxID=27848 RepID=A0A3P8FEV8_9TREM|nr:unnamed protein product [Echinostoma caproni]
MCATVAETVTGMQRRPNPCLISRPRSTFLPGVDLVDRSSDPVRSRLTTTTARPRPELYLISARNSTRQADTTPQPNGDPVDLDWTVGSNTASSTSVRQRRSRDATDRIGVLCPKESPVRTTRTSSSDFRTNFNIQARVNVRAVGMGQWAYGSSKHYTSGRVWLVQIKVVRVVLFDAPGGALGFTRRAIENISPVCTVSTPVNTTTATAAAVSGDVTSDPRDRLADTEVEQTVADQDSVWWLSLLPYKPSNLPTNLADRLRQRNSLVLARCSPSARLSNSSLPTTLPHLVHPTPPSSTQPPGIGSRLGVPIHLAGESLRSQPMMMMMMTQSLYEQRDPPDQAYMTSSDQLSPPDMTTPRGSRQELRSGRPSRYRLPTRPSSLYVDKPDPPAILMPSLAHLSAIGCSSSGETGLSRPGTLWDRRASAGHINQSDGSSSGPGTSPSPSGDSNFATEGPTDPLSMLSSYTSTTIPPTDPILTKTWSAEKTDSPLLGQYCRLLNLRTVQSNPTGPGASATNSDLPTPSAETPLTPV